MEGRIGCFGTSGIYNCRDRAIGTLAHIFLPTSLVNFNYLSPRYLGRIISLRLQISSFHQPHNCETINHDRDSNR